ncbi:hypothetical protein LTR64_007774 [Lithohypha guttulata]|uniref:Uncharacterized protein n=1 Tax=Lithohypha guttulata TaxID=1690604 RepID=A0AAN7SYN9_9EURO|nr:hypothetical protein LTR51_007285 [Lithohypha guttulata]KAK5084476.1 hypothetical protein LTR05_005552 [Lithohypha guttulata]
MADSFSSAKPGNTKQVKSSKGKSDIFTAHNRNVKKRAARDLEDENGQRHQTKDDLGAVSAADLHRSKRRMEEKVRMYNAMKRGEFVKRDDGFDDRGLVDFDRKWAQTQYNQDDSDLSDQSEDDDAQDANEIVEYTDEFGRLRKGTKKEVEKEERRSRIQAIANEDAEQFAAHPQMPTNVIYGDAVQHQAFNPDRTIAEQMAELVKKRDKSATPPPATHFDANAEIRTKGTAFYNFSHHATEREREMAELEKTRLETERIRKEKTAELQKQNSTQPVSTPAAPLNEDAKRFLDEFELPEREELRPT